MKELEDLAEAIEKLDTRSRVLGEIIATLSIPQNHLHMHPHLREWINIWRGSLGMDPVEWGPEPGGKAVGE